MDSIVTIGTIGTSSFREYQSSLTLHQELDIKACHRLTMDCRILLILVIRAKVMLIAVAMLVELGEPIE